MPRSYLLLQLRSNASPPTTAILRPIRLSGRRHDDLHTPPLVAAAGPTPVTSAPSECSGPAASSHLLAATVLFGLRRHHP